MYSRWPFPPDPLGDGAVPARDLVLTFTVVAMPTSPVDGHECDPRRAPAQRGQSNVERTDEVIHGLRIITDRVGDAVVIRANGEVDARNVDGLAATLRTNWEATRAPSPLVVDLTEIVFFSVGGLALLIATEQQCRERELELRLVITSRSLLRALRITGLDVLFAITPTVVAAIRPHAGPKWNFRTQP
jgi:anti-anti-sigma factor